MLCRAVSLVAAKVISRIDLTHLSHVIISCDLGYDGCSSDAEALLVALDYGLCLYSCVEPDRVDKKHVDPAGCAVFPGSVCSKSTELIIARLYRSPHGILRRLKYVDIVDLSIVCDPYPVSDSLLLYDLRELLPLLCGELL